MRSAWVTATWVCLAVAVVAFLVYVARGDVSCGDNGCPTDGDTWSLMAREARIGVVTAIVSAVLAAVTLLHPDHRGARLGLALATLGLAGWATINVAGDHGDLPLQDISSCDDSPGAQTAFAAAYSSKCAADATPTWDDVYWLPPLSFLAGLVVLLVQGVRRLRTPRKARQ